MAQVPGISGVRRFRNLKQDASWHGPIANLLPAAGQGV